MDDGFTLGIAQRALRAAIFDQKELIEMVPRVGLDPRPFEAELARLKLRLLEVQKQIIDLE